MKKSAENQINEEVMRQGLFDRILKQIKEDIENGAEPLEELLTFVPFDNLVGYLPEEEWDTWYAIRKNVIGTEGGKL